MKTLLLSNNADAFKDYSEGDTIDQLPLLLAEGREPLFMADVMDRRANPITPTSSFFHQMCKEMKDAWWDNRFYTGDLWLKDPENGNGKIVCYGSQALELLKRINFEQGVLPLTHEEFEQIDGLGLTYKEQVRLSTRGYTFRQAEKSREWRYLAGSQDRLEKYVSQVVKEVARTGDLMALYPNSSSGILSIAGREEVSRVYVADRIQTYKNIGPGQLIGILPGTHAKRDPLLNL